VRTRGFTLIEVMVTLALMSFIGAILIESVRMGGHSWQRITRKAANTDEIVRAQDFLREHLQSIYPPKPPSQQVFVGENTVLEFSSAAPGQWTTGLAHYRVAMSDSEPGDVEIQYRAEPAAASAGSSERLVAHAKALDIQFWEMSAGTAGHWVSRWLHPGELPRLIRIEVRFSEADPRSWPPLYVETRVDARADCVFDVVSRRCRAGV
jgi:prepilin-type N-terminal cleavage/methylation domain-containing protein